MALTGDKIVAMATVGNTQDTSGTTTSTVYTSTLTSGTACGVAFVAPPSGIVLILNNLALYDSVADFSFCSIRVRTGGTVGSGTDVLAVSDIEAVYHKLTTDMVMSKQRLLTTGLTAGSTYNVQQLFKVASGTGTFYNKRLVVAPQI